MESFDPKTFYLGAKILVVDDEIATLHTIKRNLTGLGFVVETASDGQQALTYLEQTTPDLLLLDIRMPRMNGLEVCRRVREWNELPIIVLSAGGEEDQKVIALELGADDYLTKPFSMKELVARVKAALRRSRRTKSEVVASMFTSGDLVINFAQRLVTLKGQEVKLTPQQYELLKYLAQNAGRVITHRQLLLNVWGPEFESETQYLHVFISQLRQKIEVEPMRSRYLLTERGVGYRFVRPGS
jgi:two-component system, OmpR family, KDP operon response regulator KdpE